MLPHYVYVLIDPQRDNEVFYVGMGQGTRAEEHARQALRDLRAGREHDHPKMQRLRALIDSGGGVEAIDIRFMSRVVARFETREEAFAVEAVLIHFVYGMQSLTNTIGGRRNERIRPKGNWGLIPDLDVPQPVRARDGAFRNRKIAGLSAAGAYDFLDEAVTLLSDSGFAVRHFSASAADRPYDPGESNGHLGLLVQIEGIDLAVIFSKTKSPSIWIATTQNTRSHAHLLKRTAWQLTAPKNQVVNGEPRFRGFGTANQHGTAERIRRSRGDEDQDVLDRLARRLTELREDLQRARDAGVGI